MNLPAQKVEIIALKERYEEILEELQSSGAVEVITVDPEGSVKKRGFEERKRSLELSLAQARFVKDFLTPFIPSEGFLSDVINSFFSSKEEHTMEELQNLASSPTTKETVKEVQKLEKSLNEIQHKKENLKREIEDLEKFSGISIVPKKKLDLFNIYVGSIDKNKKETLEDALKERSIFFYLEWGEEEKKRDVGFCMVYPKDEESLVKVAEEQGARKESITWEKEPKEALKEKKEALENLEKEEKEQKKRATELSREVPKFKALIDFYTWELQKLEAFQSGEETSAYFYLKAWMRPDKIEETKKRLKKRTPYFTIREVEPEEGESIPVFVKNEGLMKSFEVVTKVYGFPKRDEPDPTPYLAPFFAVAFGLALSDAGYGILLLALSYFLKRTMEETENFFNLFIISGAFTIVAGILTGTFFGTDIFEGLRVMDAMENPINIMLLVSVLGVIQIVAGLVVGLIWNLRIGRKDIAFGPKLGSLVFFAGLGFFFLTESLPILFAFIALMMGLNIFFKKEESIAKKIMGGFGSLYDLVGYFSDVLSYSRLLALGLATGIIGMTINMIAEISMEMIPVAGLNILIAGIILVLGHFANLAINALSAFIHSARLQFVEFFSKFMEGGGEELKPLNKQGRFIKLINE